MEAQYATVWERNSDVIPDKIALICGDVQVTWREYDDRLDRNIQEYIDYCLAYIIRIEE